MEDPNLIVTFSDLFTKDFLAMQGNSISNISTLDVIINILVTFAMGVYIFFIYKKTFQGVLYQKSFNLSLVIVSVVTSLIIIIINGNLSLSLGMVGALSIVRFRTPVKDSIDLAFLFWAISVGIGNGVGVYNVTITGSILIGLILLFASKIQKEDNTYIMTIRTSDEKTKKELSIEGIESLLPKNSRMTLKSKAANSAFIEMIFDLRLTGNEIDFLDTVNDKYKEANVNLISYRGDLSTS